MMLEWIGCDRCHVAQAMYQVKLLDGELYFCGHHFNENKTGLDKVSYEIVELHMQEEEQQLEKVEM